MNTEYYYGATRNISPPLELQKSKRTPFPMQLNQGLKKQLSTVQYKSAQQAAVGRLTKGPFIPRHRQKQQNSLIHPLRKVVSALQRQPAVQQPKLIRQVVAVQPAIPQQLTHQRQICQQDSIAGQTKVPIGNLQRLSFSVQQNKPQQCTIRPAVPQQQTIVKHAVSSKGNLMSTCSVLLNQLQSVVYRPQTTNPRKQPTVRTPPKYVRKHVTTSLTAKRSKLYFEKSSTLQLSQVQLFGKVKKPTAPNVQQRQIIEQMKKYITMYPQDLEFIKKSVTAITQDSNPLAVQQIPSATLPLRSSHNTTNFNKIPVKQPFFSDVESENELRCPICTELFIEAMTLPCSHTFCRYCLIQWRKTKSLCPICYVKITKEYPTRAINNYIEKIVENACPMEKERRREIVAQRLAATYIKNKKRPADFLVGTSKRVFK